MCFHWNCNIECSTIFHIANEVFIPVLTDLNLNNNKTKLNILTGQNIIFRNFRFNTFETDFKKIC